MAGHRPAELPESVRNLPDCVGGHSIECGQSRHFQHRDLVLRLEKVWTVAGATFDHFETGEASRFIEDFDMGLPVKPFTFSG